MTRLSIARLDRLYGLVRELAEASRTLGNVETREVGGVLGRVRLRSDLAWGHLFGPGGWFDLEAAAAERAARRARRAARKGKRPPAE